MNAPIMYRLLWCVLSGVPVVGLSIPCRAQQTSSRVVLLVDDHDVLYRSGTRRVLNRPKRCAMNPVVKPTKPWEVAIAWSSVYRDKDTGRYQLWYQAYAGNAASDKTRNCVVCYAESNDGVHFIKPNLRLFDFNGIKETNIVLVGNGGYSTRYANSVVYDPRDPDASRRYKMGYYDFGIEAGQEGPGLFIAFSPDGIHWKKQNRSPLLRTSYGQQGEQIPMSGERGRPWAAPLSMSDAVDIFYDPVRRLFVYYGKMWIDGPEGGMYYKHAMGRTESRDFIHWSRPRLICAPDDLDEGYVEFHTSPVFYYEGVYFCLNQILNRGIGGGVIDIELMLSRDGMNWRRPFRRAFGQPYFIERSEGNHFDSGSIFTNATPVILDDEIRFYYGGYSQGATSADDTKQVSGVGMAWISRDRFAGVASASQSKGGTLREAVKDAGQVTMKPIDLSGIAGLTLNADASQGEIRVELLNRDGKRMPGFTREDAISLHGDSLRHRVQWKEHGVRDLPAGEYLVRVYLHRAMLYSVTFEFANR